MPKHPREWGDPVYSVRMPAHVMTGLKILARREQTTTSAIIRDLIIAELNSKGITIAEKPIDGQMKIE